MPQSDNGERRSWLDRFLNVFCDVHAGEAPKALLLALNLCLILFAYYLLKTIREPLILAGKGGGAEIKSYAGAAQAVVLAVVATVFGLLAQRFSRLKLVVSVTLFFAANLVIFFVLHHALPTHQLALGIAFFVWVGCFSVTLIAQFWAFANDLYDKDEGKRLFALVAAGSAIGAVAGAKAAKPLFLHLGAYPLMLIAAAIIAVCLLITWAINSMDAAKVAAASKDPEGANKHHAAAETSKNGFALMLHDKYLLLVGALSVVKNFINTTGEYILDRRLIEVAHTKFGANEQAVSRFIGAFKSDYFAYVNAAVLVMQLFAVSRIIKYLGIRKALFILPVFAILGYSSMALFPILGVIFAAKIVENTTDYSLQKTLEQTFFLVTSRDAKYKVKAIVDTFLVRSGDVLSAGAVGLGAYLKLNTGSFILINLGALALYTTVLVAFVREHAKRSEAQPTAANEAAAPQPKSSGAPTSSPTTRPAWAR